jgi:uncharacterized delta-60 repeat protein
MQPQFERLETRVLFAAGELDEDFSYDGRDARDFYDDDDSAQAVVVQPDGRILVLGFTENGSQSDVAMIRYNPDGSRNQQFGVGGPDGNGKVTFDVGGYNNSASSVALQKNGKILVAGRAVAPDVNDDLRNFGLVARFHKNGTLDTTFADDGVRLLDFGILGQVFVQDIAVQRNDRIVVLASVTEDGGDEDIGLARLRKKGALDSTFAGSDGFGLTDLAGDNAPRAVALQNRKDGQHIIVTGQSGILFVARFGPDGLLDEDRFGDEGYIEIEFELEPVPEARDVAVLPSGRIAVVGYTETHGILSLLKPAGTVIDTIGSDETGFRHLFESVAIQHDNQIVVGGAATDGNIADLLVARFGLVSGALALDTTFGDGGLFKGQFEDFDISSANDIAIQPDGNIVAAGGISPSIVTVGAGDFAVMRVQAFADETGWISGTAYRDKNGNGILNANDTPHSFVRIYIDLDEDGKFDANLEPSALTDALGQYTIAGLLPGSYRVRQIAPPGFDRTIPGSAFYSVTLSPAEHETEIDFGNTKE